MKKQVKTNTLPQIKTKGKTLKRVLNNWELYLMLVIPLTYIIIFNYVPMYGVQIAFRDFSPIKGIFGSDWIGLENFTKFFNDYQFKRIITNTLILSFYQLIVTFPFPIILALMLNCVTRRKYKKTVQMVTYMPHFISTVVIVGIMAQLFNARIGIYAQVYEFFTGHLPDDIFSSAKSFRHLYVWSAVWQNAGWGTIIYMATLASVGQDQHEAAMVDGASRFQRVIHVDLPAIVPTMIIMLILSTGQIMNIGFEKVFLMQNALNLEKSEIIPTYVYKVGLAAGVPDYSYSTAIGLFNSVVNCILIVTVNQISRKVSETSLW